MTDTPYDRAPGEISTTAEAQRLTLSDFGIYTVAGPRSDPHGHLVLGRQHFAALGARRRHGPCRARHRANGCSSGLFPAHHHRVDNTNNVLALAFGMLIVFLVVVGSLWIMTNLNDNMMPSSELMNLHMQH